MVDGSWGREYGSAERKAGGMRFVLDRVFRQVYTLIKQEDTMRNALLCSVLAVIGLLVCWNAQIAIAAEEASEPQAIQHEGMAMQPPPPDMAGRHEHPMRMLWPGDRARREFWCAVGLLKAALLVLFACHILLAAWIYSDIRKLGQGHGIFIALALLAGFPAAILYALVRIGDKKG